MGTENPRIPPQKFTGTVIGRAATEFEVENGKVTCVRIAYVDFEDPDGLNVWTRGGFDELDNRAEIIDHVESQPWPTAEYGQHDEAEK